MSAGWKHGDSLDEQAKTHPLLKPYKALSEKVWNWVIGGKQILQNSESLFFIFLYSFSICE